MVSGHYAASLAALGDSTFHPATGVQVRILDASDTTYRAVASDRRLDPAVTCAVTVRLSASSSVVECTVVDLDWLGRWRPVR